MNILGLNAFHGDSSACILKDGKILVAIEEERIRRIKHWAGFPIEAIKYCLQDSKLTINDIDAITISRDPSANILKKLKHSFKNNIGVKTLWNRFSNSRKVGSIKTILARELGISEEMIRAKIINVEHHRSHLASSYYPSPFNEAALLSIDGFGDFTSTMTGIGIGNDIKIIDSIIFPHSAGIFYTAFTQYLGFPKYGDEYKVMGLAPYGKPVYLDKLKEIIFLKENGLFELNLDFFTHHQHGVNMSWEGGEPEIGNVYSPALEDLFGNSRKVGEELDQHHRDIASSVQRCTENLIFHILNNLYDKTQCNSICLSGGVAQNSVANGKILSNTPFKKLYIPPAGHDAGTAIGSALFHYFTSSTDKNKIIMDTASLGSQFSENEIREFLIKSKIEFKELEKESLFDLVTDCIIDGGVVGWFQGRAEFGPRALGHRSILVDPRRKDAKEILNLKIKRRESFRPFAPSILNEFSKTYFVDSDEVPFMEKVYIVREEVREKIPAVTHVDGTGRLQTVDKEIEPIYHGLIHSFFKKTGIPVLLNTSFNENEPIVNSPSEALDCFLRTKMDMLVLENFVIRR